MKKILWALFFCFAPLSADDSADSPNDQLLVVFGSSGYVLYKVLDFANDHGFRYIKILSYDFHAFDHQFHSVATNQPALGGRYFELKDAYSNIAFLCYERAPEDPYIIDLEIYRPLLENIINAGE